MKSGGLSSAGLDWTGLNMQAVYKNLALYHLWRSDYFTQNECGQENEKLLATSVRSNVGI